MAKKIVFSFGGGLNSAAIMILIKRGLIPRPDYIVIADTAREAQATWDYIDNVANPYLAQIGLSVEIAPHSLATVDLYSGNGDILIPAYTQTGKLPTFCSNEWKQRVVYRWLRSRGVKECDMMIGFSMDDLERVKPAREKWINRVYPLLDMHMTRRDCTWLFEDEKLPPPVRSACWMCPHRDNDDWRTLKNEYPDDFAKAIQLEKEIRENDSGLWLHRSRRTLSTAEFPPGEQ